MAETIKIKLTATVLLIAHPLTAIIILMRRGFFWRSAVVLLAMAGMISAQAQNTPTRDEQLYALARTDLKAFAQKVSQDATSELGRAQAIVRWLAVHFEWKATDYQKRTVQEIVERRGGNCNELAMVAVAAMKELNIRLRRVHEVNLHTNTPDRGERAHQMVKEKGKPSQSLAAVITIMSGWNCTTQRRRIGFLPIRPVVWWELMSG